MDYSLELAEKLQLEHQALRKPKIQLELDLHQLADKLRVPRAKVFLQQGVLRRLGVIERCVANIFEIFPPSREIFLNKNELSDVTINLHAFVINVYGILDNLAWVCALEGEFPELNSNKFDIGLFKTKMRPYLPEKFLTYLDQGPTRVWFDDYAKVYRDSTSHRIPPYIPPKKMSPEEAARYSELYKESMNALYEQRDVDKFELLEAQIEAMGSTTSFFVLTLSGEEDKEPPMHMHPQLLCDTLTIHELLKHFAIGFREKYDLPPAYIPEFNLGEIFHGQS
jgi:hypothetical protein